MLSKIGLSTDWFPRRANRDVIMIAVIGAVCLALAQVFTFLGPASYAWELQATSALLFLTASALVFSVRRISDLRAAAEVGSRLARHDDLTGLPNRRAFLEQLHAWKTGLHPHEQCALLFLDLDDFKPINDIYGHRLGDEVLRTMAQRLTAIVSDRGLVARMGGDEFGILLPMVSERDAAVRIAQTIVDELPQPIQLAALSVNIGVSVGIAFCCAADEQLNALTAQDGSAIETVIRQADMALYQAKAREGSDYQVFCLEMDEQLVLRIELEREIGPAIAAGEIIPHYQPLIDLKSGEIVGCEVLARWKHPKRGLLPPSTFIPVAKCTGNIARLTYALLRQAIKDSKTWPYEFSLSVNLSPRMIPSKWLAQEILQILVENSFPARRLELEITETSLISPTNEARATLKSLRNLGVKIALDDFGAGYSNLSYLRDFDFDRVKIDRSFVAELVDNPKHLRLVETIISFCHTLGMQTTAEGIETVELADRLTKLGCDHGQGFFFCRPKPNDELLLYFETRNFGFKQSA